METEEVIELKERSTLPEGWDWRTMDEVSEVVGGATPKTSELENYEGGTIAWLTPADLSGYTDKYIEQGARFITKKGLESCSTKLLPKGTVLFTSRAPIGYVAIASREVCTNQGFKSFVLDNAQVTPDYVYWWLKGAKSMAEEVASGTTFLELSTAKAKKLPIPVAPLLQQRRIVEAIELQLGRLDAAVARLQGARARLKRYKQAVLKAAYTGQLWTEGADMSDEAPLPEGWRWGTLGDFVKIRNGFAFKSTDYLDEGVLLIRQSNLGGEKVTTEGAKYLPPSYLDAHKEFQVHKGDILIGMSGSIGKLCTYDLDEPALQNQRTGLLQFKDPKQKPWVWNYLPMLEQSLLKQGKGVAVLNISAKQIEASPMPIPPVEVQARIIDEVEQRIATIAETETTLDAQLQQAVRLRQAVLKRAFEGRLV